MLSIIRHLPETSIATLVLALLVLALISRSKASPMPSPRFIAIGLAIGPGRAGARTRRVWP